MAVQNPALKIPAIASQLLKEIMSVNNNSKVGINDFFIR